MSVYPKPDELMAGPLGQWLEAQGSVAGAAFNDHQYSMNRWGDYYDGIVVFRAERPPERLDE